MVAEVSFVLQPPSIARSATNTENLKNISGV